MHDAVGRKQGQGGGVPGRRSVQRPRETEKKRRGVGQERGSCFFNGRSSSSTLPVPASRHVVLTFPEAPRSPEGRGGDEETMRAPIRGFPNGHALAEHASSSAMNPPRRARPVPASLAWDSVPESCALARIFRYEEERESSCAPVGRKGSAREEVGTGFRDRGGTEQLALSWSRP